MLFHHFMSKNKAKPLFKTPCTST